MTPPNNAPYKYLQFKGDQSYSRYIREDIPAKSPPAKTQDPGFLNAKSHGSYGALLFHPNWKAKRKEILHRDMHRCVHCSSDKDLQVHHRQYHFIASEQKFRLPWEYPGHLLITLCESCHSKGHNKYKVPTITI
ncbi:HNH endonuclease [Chitinophaga sp. 22321]|uniref:HNH endonuclease n=1 Tax=Chitinophaga TaxID=79328 RepID=UPI002013268B|nr:hypothetical protein [Chitinophaga hostae]